MNHQIKSFFSILILLAAFPVVCTLLFTPGLPDIAKFLSISAGEAQKSISIFLIGYAFGFLPWGPIANDIGRKKTAIIGILIALLGLIISLSVKVYPSIFLLNSGRFITAIGSSVGLKISYTYLSDLYPKEEILNKVSYLLIALAATASLSATIGGFLTTYFGWFSCFLVMLIYCLSLLIAASHLPETLKKENHIPLNLINVYQGYKKKLSNPFLIKASILMGLCTSFTYLFASIAPFIVIKEMGFTAKAYGLFNVIPALGVLVGFYLVQRMKNRFSHKAQLRLGLSITLPSIVFIIFLFFTQLESAFLLFSSLSIINSGIILTFANSSTLALSSSEDKSNTSAIMNFINMTTCCVMLFISEALPFDPSILLTASFTILGLLQLVLWKLLQKHLSVKS